MIRRRWDALSTWRISLAAVWGGPVGARARQSPSSCCGRRTGFTSGVVSTRAAIRRCRRFRKPWRAPWRPPSRARSAPSSERRWRAAHRAIPEPTIASCARTTSSHSGRRAPCVGRSTSTRAPCCSIPASRPPSPGWPSVTGCSSTGGGSIPACLRRPCCLAGSTRRTAARQPKGGAARRWADSALAIDPGADYAYVLRALAEFRLGQRAEARADAETAARLRSGFRVPAEAVLALVELQAADTLAARTRIERLEREIRSAGNQTITDAAWVGRALVAPGKSDRALELLERVRPRGARLWFYLRAPEFDPVRTDPRFQRLVAESRPE